MYVGAASQHVLRMSFVPEEEAKNFDTQLTAFWPHFIQRDVTSLLFILPLKLGGLGALMATNKSPFSTRHHDLEPNLINFKPHSHHR